MEYIKANETYADEIFVLVQKTIKTIYPKYYPQEVVEFFCQLHNKDNIATDIKNGYVNILCDNGNVVGTGSRKDNHITRVYVLPKLQGKGYGSYIMNCLESEIAAEYDYVELDASLPASRLYEHRGYKTLRHEEHRVKNDVVLVYEVMEKLLRRQKSTPILETERLILRPFEATDAEPVFLCWESDPEVSKYMFWTSHNDIEKTKEWIKFELGQIPKDDWYRFALVLKDTKELIGTGLIYYEDEVSSWEIGYNLGRKYWGKGYTTEAMREILAFAKNELKLKEVVGRYAKENAASEKIMKKLGFEFEKDIDYYCNNGAVCYEGTQCRLYL